MAAIHVAGVRGDPCGAVRWTQSNAGLSFYIFEGADLSLPVCCAMSTNK